LRITKIKTIIPRHGKLWYCRSIFICDAIIREQHFFELGFFIGKLGPERVAALVKGDIELPSDYEDWQTKLGVELQAAGFEFDWNKVMRR
jgi:hypothetical protein